jgi:shikimate kinase
LKKEREVRLFIIGYKSSGKTTIGRKIAQKLGMDFIDLDELIEKREGKTVPELYTQNGNEEFRNMEWEALKEVVEKENIIVSTGGGAPCHCDNMNLMEKKGEVLYIELDDDTLISRLKFATKDRPIVLNKTDEELRDYVKNMRYHCEHHYRRAKYVVNGKNLNVDKVVEAIESLGIISKG